MKVAEFARIWIERYPRPVDATNEHNEIMLRQFVSAYGATELDDLRRSEIREWALAHRGAAGVVRAMLNDAMNDEFVERNVFADLRLPGSRGRRDIVVPTEEEIRALRIAAEPPVDSMIPFAAYTGLRLGEQLALEGSDLRPPGRVTVTKQLDSKGRLRGPKTASSVREALLPPEADAGLQVPAEGRIWPISRTQHFRRWDRARKTVGVEFDWHELRHFNATWLLERGGWPEDIGAHLGHEDGMLVVKLYGHPNRRKALERLERLAA